MYRAVLHSGLMTHMAHRIAMRSAMSAIPTRATAPGKGGKKGKEKEKKVKKPVKEEAVQLSPEEEWKQALAESKLNSIKTIKKDWGAVKDLMMSDEFPDWLWELENLVPIPPEGQDNLGHTLKYNPNDPNELRIYAKKQRRARIKRQNAMMKATKGIPQKK